MNLMITTGAICFGAGLGFTISALLQMRTPEFRKQSEKSRKRMITVTSIGFGILVFGIYMIISGLLVS